MPRGKKTPCSVCGTPQFSFRGICPTCRKGGHDNSRRMEARGPAQDETRKTLNPYLSNRELGVWVCPICKREEEELIRFTLATCVGTKERRHESVGMNLYART